MKQKNSTIMSIGELCVLHDEQWLINQRMAGKIAARTLVYLEILIKEKTTKSLKELDTIAENFILASGGTCPLKGYRGFPAVSCMSVNKQLVHSIPNDYKLQDGDLITIDLDVEVNGSIADTAITLIYGEPKSPKHTELIKATEEALMAGIEAIKVGNRLGCIGEAICKTGKKYGVAVIDKYGGHGLGSDLNGKGLPHCPPFVCNRDSSNNGIRIENGLVIAIEPLFVLGNSNRTRTSDDNWTVICDEVCAHSEHSIFINNGVAEIITDRTGL